VGLTLPPRAVGTSELGEGGIRALEGELEALCASVDDVFARPASRENLRAMVRGLLGEVPRKNMWQLAEFAGHPNPDRLQGFLAKAAWDADELRDRVRAFAVAALADQVLSDSRFGHGTALVVMMNGCSSRDSDVMVSAVVCDDSMATGRRSGLRPVRGLAWEGPLDHHVVAARGRHSAGPDRGPVTGDQDRKGGLCNTNPLWCLITGAVTLAA
jgi:hypothetical protein